MKRKHFFGVCAVIVVVSGCIPFSPDDSPSEEQPTFVPVPTATAPAASISGSLPPLAPGNIDAVWANDGGDKVTRDELRASSDPDSVGNSVWDGTGISLFGARNEVVSFNLVLEAPTAKANNIAVTVTELPGPNGSIINTRPTSGDDVFNYVDRNIELFYVRYLEIKGISTDLFYTGYSYDERHIPARCRRPYNTDGEGQGSWEDRPCHNTFYPDIAVPLELNTPFSVDAGSNQSIWGDIYIPKDSAAGDYNGTISVTEDGVLRWEIPVSLHVYDFALPDLPSARTMVYISTENINDRYLGEEHMYPSSDEPAYADSVVVIDRHFQLAHRHKISLIDSYLLIDEMEDVWLDRLNGTLFTPERGYSGIGEGVGNNVYSIGTYGGWPWQGEGRGAMQENAAAWVDWFDAHPFDTPTEYFLYLVDESDNYREIERWAQWIEESPGSGSRLMSMATINLPDAAENTPSLDIPTSLPQVSLTEEWADPVGIYTNASDKRYFMYNGTRPMTGSHGIEDEGVSLRELAWGQYKMGIQRWFYWEATYYNNFQGDTGQTNVFAQAQTFGGFDEVDGSLGETGENYLNGDGVLIYPGTDTRFPEDSYGVNGPFASLRLKHWRRGIQDVDYLTMAADVDPERTQQIVDAMVPRIMWEVGVSDRDDPTWVRTNISWPTNPDVWEAARLELAEIIESGT